MSLLRRTYHTVRRQAPAQVVFVGLADTICAKLVQALKENVAI
jgi:hypothetical protein